MMVRSVPAACCIAARTVTPSGAVRAPPELRTVSKPRAIASATAATGSVRVSTTRCNVAPIGPAASRSRDRAARSSRPSAVAAPRTTPSSPAARTAAMSWQHSSSSSLEKIKVPDRGRIITRTGRSMRAAQRINPNDGVRPPRDRAEQSSIRSTPARSAASRPSRVSTQTSNRRSGMGDGVGETARHGIGPVQH